MKTKLNRLLIVVGMLLMGALVMGACSGLENPNRDTPGEDPSSGEELDQESILALVKADLAAREGVDLEEIGSPSIESLTWEDTSLGCPQEGLNYAQTLTPGYRILLAIGGPASIEQFDYRTDTLGNFLLCEG